MSMMLNASFAQELAAWKLNVPGLGDMMEQWEALHRLVLDDPLGPLCAQVQAGEITTPELIKAAKGAAISSGDRDRVVAVRQALDQPLSRRFGQILVANADSIIRQLQDPFSTAADAIVAAVPAVPAGISTEDLLSMGGAAVEAWHTLANAAAQLDAIAGIRQRLTHDFGYPRLEPLVVNYLASARTADDLTTAEFAFRGLGISGGIGGIRYDLDPARGGRWEHVIRAGYSLRLNTAREASVVAALRPLDPEPVAA